MVFVGTIFSSKGIILFKKVFLYTAQTRDHSIFEIGRTMFRRGYLFIFLFGTPGKDITCSSILQ
jgi:hypothetical protein